MIRHSKPNIKRSDLKGVLECLVSDNIADGETVKEFERQFASLYKLRSNHAVAVSSGTDALHLGLLALGIGAGDEVILPSYVCTSPYHAICHTGATPVLCDIGEDYNIAFESARKALSKRTRAIVVPHLFGQPADLQPFLDLDIPIIEDCAQALGATWQDKLVGSFGKFAFFSFYATKVITTGHGGMFLSRDLRLAAAVRSMRVYDKKEELTPSFNSQLSDIQAAMGINQLKRLDHFVNLRQQIAEVYNRKLLQTHHQVPQAFPNRSNIYFRYPIRVKRSLKAAIDFMRKNNIETAPPLFRPLHQYLNLSATDFPGTEQVFLKTLSIPIYPALLNKEVEYIARVAARII